MLLCWLMDAVISFHQLAGGKFLQVGHEEEQRTGGCSLPNWWLCSSSLVTVTNSLTLINCKLPLGWSYSAWEVAYFCLRFILFLYHNKLRRNTCSSVASSAMGCTWWYRQVDAEGMVRRRKGDPTADSSASSTWQCSLSRKKLALTRGKEVALWQVSEMPGAKASCPNTALLLVQLLLSPLTLLSWRLHVLHRCASCWLCCDCWNKPLSAPSDTQKASTVALPAAARSALTIMQSSCWAAGCFFSICSIQVFGSASLLFKAGCCVRQAALTHPCQLSLVEIHCIYLSPWFCASRVVSHAVEAVARISPSFTRLLCLVQEISQVWSHRFLTPEPLPLPSPPQAGCCVVHAPVTTGVVRAALLSFPLCCNAAGGITEGTGPWREWFVLRQSIQGGEWWN